MIQVHPQRSLGLKTELGMAVDNVRLDVTKVSK